MDLPKDSDSVLTWCYFDSEAGITFEYICPYNSKEKISHEIDNKNFSYKWRKEAVNDYEMEVLPQNILVNKLKKETIDYIRFIIENYENDNELNETRQVLGIDHLREKDYPDDIMVTLYKDELNPETLWVRLLTFKNGDFTGKIQNEPYQNFGVHLGDIIKIQFGKDKDGV
jgi:hypothetical protein